MSSDLCTQKGILILATKLHEVISLKYKPISSIIKSR
jgi:hypothetical protein